MRELPGTRPTRTIAGAVCAAMLAVALLWPASSRATGAPGQDAPAPTSAFGFKLGEERRYVLGPVESLAGGEAADWTIELEGFVETPDGWNVQFEFTHDRIERVPGSMYSTDLIGVNVYGSLVTNLDGFPLELDFVQELSIAGETLSDSDVRHLSYWWDFDARRYRKNLQIGKRDWDFDFGTANYDYWEEDRPRGIYVYMPTALGCLGSSRYACFENDPAFANPGFLSILFPALLDADRGERDFMFLMPTTVGVTPFVNAMTGDWLSRERSSFESVARYFDQTKLRLGVSDDIEVGPRTRHAWELRVGTGVDRIWIEPEGRVLRVDLETTYDNSDERYIRYVFPSEEFTSPNADPALECCGD